ncbi:hypothetical protein FHS89_001988 [Rubricella aquisinus]|uniref:Amidoligase enzyme n=1 Tax=Rubricella aquisinus TaxID=2028108 RepID=A0A840WLJ7_9RHOB|nr:amidoligase family protein [Rubricella aquisinus]MBB5515968.1 hypothetical protein [Rubricella aquisinus]
MGIPQPRNAKGDVRSIGVELEFGGMTERAAADCVAGVFGGQVEKAGPHLFKIDTAEHGAFEVELDSAFAKQDDLSDLTETALDLSRGLIPVEIVAPPIPITALTALDTLCEALAAKGAEGTGGGVLQGFGMHLNVEVHGMTGDDITPILRAFALIEDWVRGIDPIDPSRRALPFVDPFPRSLVDALAKTPSLTLDDLTALYLTHDPSRNRALDMLPILALHDEDQVRAAMPEEKIAARPTYHYRLPDCRIGEPGWTIAGEVAKWAVIETVAGNGPALDALAKGWTAHRDALTTIRPDWAKDVQTILDDHDINTGAFQ